VTSAQGSRANFQDSGVTLPLSAACAAASCTGGAAPVAAAKPATAAAAVAAVAPKAPTAAVAAAGTAAPAAAAAAVAPAASKGAAAAVPGCTPSPLGYSCMATTRQGSKVHYSLGGAAPPDNACTRGTKGDATISKAGADMVHFAYEGGQPVRGRCGKEGQRRRWGGAGAQGAARCCAPRRGSSGLRELLAPQRGAPLVLPFKRPSTCRAFPPPALFLPVPPGLCRPRLH
jgi:hypothetical protein